MNVPSLFRHREVEPFRAFNRMQSELERLFADFSDNFPSLDQNGFLPSCEFDEGQSNYTVKFDMPGVKKDDVKIELDGNKLSVSAERREEKKTEDKRSRFSEITYGAFQRQFTLPGPVDESKVDAKFENGVLILTMPKTHHATTKQIPIKQ